MNGQYGMHGKPVPKPVVGALTKEPGLVFPLTMVDLIAQEITLKVDHATLTIALVRNSSICDLIRTLVGLNLS